MGAAAGAVDPSKALDRESDEVCCEWAVEAGASAAWVEATGACDARSLADVAQALV